MLHTRVVPGNLVLVRIGWVVLLRDVVAEEQIGQSLEPVCVPAGNPNGDGVVVADVDREGLARRPVEHHHTRQAPKAGEQIVLPALVVVQPADHTLPREREVRLLDRLGQLRRADELGEPAALVLVARQREAPDHALAPLRRTKSLTS